MLSNEDTEVIPDNGTVKITLYNHELLLSDFIDEIITEDADKRRSTLKLLLDESAYR